MFVKHFLTSHDRDTTSIIYQCTKMNMSKNVVIPVILFVFIICICNPKVLANEEGYKFGEKLPMTPFVVLENENSVCRCLSWNVRPTARVCLSTTITRTLFVSWTVDRNTSFFLILIFWLTTATMSLEKYITR